MLPGLGYSAGAIPQNPPWRPHWRATLRNLSRWAQAGDAGCRPGWRGGVAEAGRVQAAQCGVERGDVAVLRVVGVQRKHIVVHGAEHVFGEAVQRPLGADLDEHPCSRLIQGLQALDELHRRGDLAAEDVQHPCRHVGAAGRVELAVHVRDDRQERAGSG